MKRFFVFLTTLLVLSTTTVYAQFADIKSYDLRHPQYTTKDVINKTSNLRLSSDGEFVKIQLCVRDQSLQRRFQHEGITFYIDPSGKKRKDNVLLFQGARPPMMHPQPQPGGEEPERREPPKPEDGRFAKAMLVCAGDTIFLPAECVDISKDDYGFLTFTAVLPCQPLTKATPNGKKWQIGIFAEKPTMQFGDAPNDKSNKQQPNVKGSERPEMPQGGRGGMRGGGPGGPGGGGMRGGAPGGPGGGGMHGGGPQGGGRFGDFQPSNSSVAPEKIENWIKVSYSDMTK